MGQISVLIVGAGPAGLVLALIPARRGIRVRIIDDDEARGRFCRYQKHCPRWIGRKSRDTRKD